MAAQTVLAPTSMFGALVTFSTLSALELTTGTCDAETSGKTVFVKLDWDKLMEQWNSDNRAVTSFVSSILSSS